MLENDMLENDNVPVLPDFSELFGETELTPAEKQQKTQDCGQKVQETLNRYQCAFAPEVGFAVDGEGFVRYRYNIQLIPIKPR